jgi:hypothetical protein
MVGQVGGACADCCVNADKVKMNAENICIDMAQIVRMKNLPLNG